MATRVYLNGKVIEVEKSGGDSLTIPISRCKFTIIGTMPVNSIYDYDEVIFWDLGTEESIIDSLSKIQDSSGAFIGDNKEVKDYLTGFITKSDAKVNVQEGATKANQELIILQNSSIDEELEKLNLSNEELENIKKLQKITNKLLNKIYD